jgi:hypothetical protein
MRKREIMHHWNGKKSLLTKVGSLIVGAIRPGLRPVDSHSSNASPVQDRERKEEKYWDRQLAIEEIKTAEARANSEEYEYRWRFPGERIWRTTRIPKNELVDIQMRLVHGNAKGPWTW